jgi:SAM-dependent methyltransferase
MNISQNLRSLAYQARGTGGRLLNWTDSRVVESFPVFAPMSAGSYRDLASLTVQAADQTFPFMLELLASTGAKVEGPVPITFFLDTEAKKSAALALKDLFDYYGSDKASFHDYHLLYGAVLASRDAANVLEIGLGTNNKKVVSNMGMAGKPGASLRAFRDFLPGAQIYGADIDQAVLFEEDRIATFFVDQTDLASFKALGESVPREFDLIIDDGLHSPNANLATLIFGLERLKPGGFLIVEDIRPDALAVWQVIANLLPDRYSSWVVAARGALLFVVQRLA